MTEHVGPYYITTRVDHNTTEMMKSIADPFIHHTVYIEDRIVRWLKWPRIKHEVSVIIDADPDIVDVVIHATAIRLSVRDKLINYVDIDTKAAIGGVESNGS